MSRITLTTKLQIEKVKLFLNENLDYPNFYNSQDQLKKDLLLPKLQTLIIKKFKVKNKEVRTNIIFKKKIKTEESLQVKNKKDKKITMQERRLSSSEVLPLLFDLLCFCNPIFERFMPFFDFLKMKEDNESLVDTFVMDVGYGFQVSVNIDDSSLNQDQDREPAVRLTTPFHRTTMNDNQDEVDQWLQW